MIDNINNVLHFDDIAMIRPLCVPEGAEFVIIISTKDQLYEVVNLLQHLGVTQQTWDMQSAITYLERPKGLGLVVRPLREIGYSDIKYLTSGRYANLQHIYLQAKD